MESIRGYVFFKDVFLKGQVDIEGGKIIAVKDAHLTEEEEKQYIIPGLVDIHTHGCAGHDTCDGDEEGLRAMLKYQREHGTTSYFPTTMTFHEDKVTDVVKNIKKVAETDKTVKGIYLEGPFISREKCGAQNPDYIMKPDIDMLHRVNEASGGLCRFVAIAPEQEGAMECIKAGKDEFKFSIAHTTADYDKAKEAIDAGANHITHFFNAMPGYTHRAPGVIGAAMDTEDIRVELISDGIHIHPAVVRNTFKYFGGDRVILISDSMEATGMKDGEYALGGQKVIVKGRLATLENGTIAGSASNLFDCLTTAIKMGVPKEEAIKAATSTPAKEAGIFDTVGSIEAGKNADILVLDKDFNLKKVYTEA